MDIPIKKKQKKAVEETVETYDIFDEKPSQKLKPSNEKKLQPTAKQVKQEKEDVKLKNYVEEDGEFIFDLNTRKKVRVQVYQKEIYVNIREYFLKDGEYLPTKKGISLNLENWNKLKRFTEEIDECIQKLK